MVVVDNALTMWVMTKPQDLLINDPTVADILSK